MGIKQGDSRWPANGSVRASACSIPSHRLAACRHPAASSPSRLAGSPSPRVHVPRTVGEALQYVHIRAHVASLASESAHAVLHGSSCGNSCAAGVPRAAWSCFSVASERGTTAATQHEKPCPVQPTRYPDGAVVTSAGHSTRDTRFARAMPTVGTLVAPPGARKPIHARYHA